MNYQNDTRRSIDWGLEEGEPDVDPLKMQSLFMLGFDLTGEEEDGEEFIQGTVSLIRDLKIYILEVEMDCGCISLNIEDAMGNDFSETEISVISEWFGDSFTELIEECA